MKYLIRFFVIALASLPFFVYSATPSGLLIPCDPSPVSGGASGDCTFPKLMEMANNIIKFCIVLGSSVFAIVFMYAGYLYLTAMGDTGQISKAHGLFWNAIIGFVIMLAAWLFVDFIFTALSVPTSYRLLSK